MDVINSQLQVRPSVSKSPCLGTIDSSVTRREFIAAVAATVAVGAAGQTWAAENKNEMPYRTLGRTGERISALGLGGYHIGVPKDEQEGIRIIRTAIDRGLNFMDNCWDYHDGGSETRMGKALGDGYRQRVFLMTKIDGRTRQSVARQIDESLRRLQTDRVDLMQFHEVLRFEDPDRIFAQEGGMEAMLEARKAGKVRFIGFTGHKDPHIHLNMLKVAADHGFKFDTVQMPLNCFDGTYRSFEQQVLPEVSRRGIAALGMKSLGGDGQPILHGVVSAEEALRYAMSLPVAATISGMDSLDVLRQNLRIARGFKPMAPEEMQALRQRCKTFAADGHLELYKSTKKYDASVGREQHGYPPPDQLPL